MKKNNKVLIAGVCGLVLAAGVISVSAASIDKTLTKGNKSDFKTERHQEMMEIIDSEDYGAWQEMVAGRPMAEKITEADFARLVEAHRLAQAGDYVGAKEIKEELGLFGRKCGKMGFKKGNGDRQKVK
jgi:hypothetical protein